jgi:membrane protease YdiL (CAAX protease family)
MYGEDTVFKEINIKKVMSLLLLFCALILIININRLIPALGAWQHAVLTWNYAGVFGNYILFAAYLLVTHKKPAQLGVHFGNWKKKIKWYLIVVLAVIVLTRGFDLLFSGELIFMVPDFSSIFFQLVFVSLGEELFYRGVIQTDYGFWPATILFGAVHLLNGDIAGMLAACLIGGILGIVRSKTDSVLSSALLHGIVNFTNVFFK